MNLVSIFMIAVVLAIDAFAASVSSGTTMSEVNIRKAARIALFFGGFQAAMPLFGWIAGQKAMVFIGQIAYWAAFAVLTGIGLQMMYGAIRVDQGEKQVETQLSLPILLIMSIATSIDAAAVGFSFACTSTGILTPAVIIGTVTFLLSMLGVFLGEWGHEFLGKKAQLIGAVVLISIGSKILLDGLVS
ncbi:MAG: manganese efflux pump MntP family protein [Spirochaetota bacterium]